MTAIALDDLTFSRRSGFEMGPLSLDLATGSRTAVVGPSGAGKSTLLRCLAGLERPDGGAVREDGQVVNSADHCTPPHLRQLGFLFQDGALWPHMTALQHLRFAAPRLNRSEAQQWLEQVGLGDKAKRRPAQLSGGEGRRLGLARALCGGAETLLLDEPLHSLDVHLRDGLALLIRELAKARRLTTVLVTHDREEALAMADDLVVMDRGRIVETGAAVDLLARPRTAWTAAFLCRAACWPVEVEGGVARTPFGDLPIPQGASGDLALATLPGDVIRADSNAPDHPAGPVGTVLHGEPRPGGWTLAIALQGHTLRVNSPDPVAGGTEVPLHLETPRLLPWGSEVVAP